MRVFKPARVTSVEIGSVTSQRTSVGEISHIRSRNDSTSSYGRGWPKTSESALEDGGRVNEVYNGNNLDTPNNLPVLTGSAWWRYSSATQLRATFSVYPGC
jgi:hypothetical protein